MKYMVFIFYISIGFVFACPYCAAGDSIGSTLSAYVPLVGIIIFPFVLSGVFIYISNKQK